ncbi:type II restriction endonuclease HpaII [Actinomycetota bacterium]|nr:type II restriction endonuclease HpaII [Actinomycetota bacterium]
MAVTANKGEWSELYALLKIMSERTVEAADQNLDPTTSFYTFLQIFRDDGVPLIYDLTTAGIVRIIDANGSVIKELNSSTLALKLAKMLTRIKSEKIATFPINEAEDIMNEYLIRYIKAPSTKKSDIVATLEDPLSQSAKLGFSIKSQLGGLPTLVNASKLTNFTFRVDGFSGDIDLINSLSPKSGKIQARIKAIYDSGGSFIFSHIASKSFTNNLRVLDSLLPSVLGSLILEYYLGNGRTFTELIQKIDTISLFDFTPQQVAYKIKTFLRAAALGMVPREEWDTMLSTYGGYIIVKEDGELICYHLYNDDAFKEFLFKNTKLDTPSSSRHDFGKLYTDKTGSLFFNLNLQVRFVE